LRVIAGSLVIGQFLAPGFFLALAGATTSLIALALTQHLPSRWFGAVSASIIAALAHIAGQLALARLWLVPHDGVFYLLPLFATAALVFGTINGLIAARLLAADTPDDTADVTSARPEGSTPGVSTFVERPS
jgi:heptaprenyl diphosphate synthase